jgi:hypothetical protein
MSPREYIKKQRRCLMYILTMFNQRHDGNPESALLIAERSSKVVHDDAIDASRYLGIPQVLANT